MRSPVLFPLGWKLQRRGFSTRTFSYPSMARDLRENAKSLADFVASLDEETIHVVGHSLGGLLVLAMLASAPNARIARAVLLGSPVRDCHCARTLARVPALSHVLGRSLPQWPHTSADYLAQLPAHVEIGVLAGSAGIGLGRAIPGLARPNDGVVAVHETRLDQATDTTVLPLSHSAMLLSGRCADQVAAFLRNGHFYHR
jgi:pimeloyl-ACP methyl ester carboxylesterase